MSTYPTTERTYKVLVVLAVLVLIGTAAGLSRADKGMQPQGSKGGGGGGGIDWGTAIGKILQGLNQPRPHYPPMGPYEYPREPRDTGRIYEGEPSGGTIYQGEPSGGFQMPPEIPRIPEQQEPTPKAKPSKKNLLESTGGSPMEQLTGSVPSPVPKKKPEPTPEDLLNNSRGNTQVPPTELAEMPPPGPDIQWPPQVGPDSDAIKAGRELLEQQRRAAAEDARRRAAEEAARRAAEQEAARRAAEDLAKQIQQVPEHVRNAVAEIQRKKEELQKKAEEMIKQAAKDAATDIAIDKLDELVKEADKAGRQQKPSQADAARKAQEQAERQRRFAEENKRAWQEHQAKQQKAEQERQAREAAQQQQQAQQQQLHQQQQQQNQQQQQQEDQELDGFDTKVRKGFQRP